MVGCIQLTKTTHQTPPTDNLVSCNRVLHPKGTLKTLPTEARLDYQKSLEVGKFARNRIQCNKITHMCQI